MDRRSGYVFCEPEGWQRREKIIVGRGEEKRAKIKRQQFRHSELLSDSPCSNHAAPRASAPKTKKTIWRGDVASFICLKILTTTRAPPLVTTPYRARHPSSRCAFCSCWIAHEPNPSKRRSSIEQRQGASRGATILPMLSLHLYPCFTLYPTIHLSTTGSPAIPVVSGLPLK